MSFSGLVLTNSGKGELVKCGLGQPFQITDIVFGSGQYNGTGTNIKELVNQVMSLPATSVERDSQNEDVVRVECDFNSTDVPRPFFWREIGIIANGKLCYYDNSRDDAEYIDPESETIVKQKRMRFLLMISSEVNVSPVIGSSLYAEKKDVQEVLYPNFAEATERENIASGEKISILFGKIRKWFSDLKAVAFSGSYNDLSDKPSIPSVGNGTITITQNGAVKGSFTTNQSGNATIALTDTNTQTVTGVKGNAESSYRTGNVNLTPANVGALPSANVANNNTITVAGYALDARQANPNIAGSLGAQIKAANTALATHKTSTDHDNRYPLKADLNKKIRGMNGAVYNVAMLNADMAFSSGTATYSLAAIKTALGVSTFAVTAFAMPTSAATVACTGASVSGTTLTVRARKLNSSGTEPLTDTTSINAIVFYN